MFLGADCGTISDTLQENECESFSVPDVGQTTVGNYHSDPPVQIVR